MSWTTTDLITSIKLRAQVPTSQNTYSAPDMLALATEELFNTIVPLIMSVRESYFQTLAQFSLEDDKARYRIPQRSIGMKLKDVQIENAAGDLRDLSRMEIETKPYLTTDTGRIIEGFYFDGSVIVLVPTPKGVSSDFLNLHYFKRPGKLIATSAAGLITNIDTVTKEVTISSAPTTFTSNVLYDFVQSNPGFDSLAIDQTATILGNILTFSTLPTDLAVGDYVTLAGESPIPQIPAEFHSILALRVAIVLLKGLGHRKEAEDLGEELSKLELTSTALLSPRVEGEAKKLMARNGVLNPGGLDNFLYRNS